MVKKLPANEGDMGLIHGLGRSAGGGHGNPLQYSSLENPWTREPGGLQSMGLGKSWTQLSDQTTTQLHYKVIITYHKYIYSCNTTSNKTKSKIRKIQNSFVIFVAKQN